MAKKQHITPEDQAIFRASVNDVTPLAQKRILPPPPPPPPRTRRKESEEQQIIDDMLSDSLESSELEYNEELLFSRSGLQHNVLRKLRRGQYNITAELDLHGLRVEEARQTLSQ